MTGDLPAGRSIVLRTDRLTLTTWLPSDLDDLHAMHSDPETMRYVRHGRPDTFEESAALLERYLTEQSGRGWSRWRVVDGSGRFVGRAGFGGEEERRELGYTLAREAWGRGLATEVALALVRWHREHAPRADLRAYAALENAPSRRVLEKAGFVEVGSEEYHGMRCGLFRLA